MSEENLSLSRQELKEMATSTYLAMLSNEPDCKRCGGQLTKVQGATSNCWHFHMGDQCIPAFQARIENLEKALEELKASLQHALDNPDHSRVDMTLIMEVYVLEYWIEDIDKALAAPSPTSKAEEKP